MGEDMRQLDHVGAARASTAWRRRRGDLLLAVLLVASALPGQVVADAGQRVHRCVGHNGEIVFSGLRCGEEASAIGAPGAAPAAERPRADECARSAAELRERVLAAIARHDANAIAAAMQWAGISGSAARQRMAELRALVDAPLLSLDAAPDGFDLRTGGAAEGGQRSVHFGVYDEAGCYWLDG